MYFRYLNYSLEDFSDVGLLKAYILAGNFKTQYKGNWCTTKTNVTIEEFVIYV